VTSHDVTHADTFTAAMERSERLHSAIDADPSRFTMLTGDRPTGHLHIGHYVGSLRNRVALQDKGIRSFVLIADYQVITDREAVGDLQEYVLSSVADHLAAGIDPARSTMFRHSAVPALNQLMLPFLALVTVAELERNPTVKDELLASGRAMSGLLLTYPVHQAADILFCKANVVPVGRDQLPHLEQTRVVARRFNHRFAAGRPVFPEPEALLSTTPLILGLDGAKMSKSRGNAVELRSSADQTAALLRKARTDAEQVITFEPDRRPEVANLLTIAAAFTGEDQATLADRIGSGGARALKAVVTEAINETLRDHRARRAELLSDPGLLTSILREGDERARAVADQTLAEVRIAMRMD
jgi:tryptophanyl-tRNA synthetase